VAAHGDPEFTGETDWAAEAKGARSRFGKQISGANEASVSYWCYRAKEREG
jgi:hypothetical protein